MRLITLVILFLGLVSCSTPSRKSGPLKYSLSDINRAVTYAIPARLKGRSPNGREYYFDYFPLPSDFTHRAGNTKDGKFLERAKAKVVVLGDRRPYTAEVEIVVETLQVDGTYGFDRNDTNYAAFIAEKIELDLVKRHEKRNLINDFRAF